MSANGDLKFDLRSHYRLRCDCSTSNR